MDKLLFLILSLFLMTEVKAINPEECYFQGKSFSGSNTIDQACYLSQKISSDELFEKKVRGESSLFEAHQNILWITRAQDHKAKPISGEKSLLNDILAIGLSSDEKLLAVLDQESAGVQDKKILIFGSHLTGHIKPYYVFDFPELDSAIALSFAPESTKLYFLAKDQDGNRLFSFKIARNASSVGPLFLEKLRNPIDLTQSADYLFVLDHNKKIHLYTNELQWISTIEIGPTELDSPHSIRYSIKDQTLYVSNKQGDTIHYTLD